MDYTGQSLGYELDLLPNLPQEALDTDFKKAYPPDSTLGQELQETARVWKVYRDEAKAHDDTMLDGWNKTLDVLLIFAGLFSAVATAFIIDSYKLLQPDNSAAYMSTALYLLLLRDNVSSTLPLPPPPPLEVSVSMLSKAVNWLWFTSFLLSLAVALLAILVKQWIVQYNARNTVSAESPCHWAVRHQLFFQAMRNWPVAELVSILPVMLHFALFLFFGGIALFLWDFDLAIAVWIAVLSLALGGLYIASSVIPLWIPECPTATPLVEVISKAIISLQILGLRAYAAAHKYVLRIHNVASDIVMRVHLSHVPDPAAAVLRQRLSNLQGENAPLPILRPSGTAEQLKTIIAHLRAKRSAPLTITYSQRWHDLRGDALLWLIFSVADSDSRAVGVQALGAVGTFGALERRLRGDDRLSPLIANMAYTRSAGFNSPTESARIIRSRLWLSLKTDGASNGPDVSLWVDALPLKGVDFGDMLFLSSVSPSFDGQRVVIQPPPHSASAQSNSLNSTVLLFLRARRLDFANFLTALLWCDFYWLDDTDWTFLLERIVFEAHAGTPLYILPSTRHRVTVLDVLAQLVMSAPVHRNAPAIHVLIVAILPSFASDGRELCNHSFLYHYLASDAFAAQKLEDGILAQHIIPSLLYDASQIMHPIPSVYDHPPTIHLLLSAVTVSLHMQKQAGLTFHARYNTLLCVDAVEWYTLRAGVRDAQALSLMLRRILEPAERLSGLSLWDMLRARWGSAFLAMRLIQALCVAERLGEAVSDLANGFLLGLSLRDLADMFNLQRNYTPDEITSEQVPDFPTWVEPAIRHSIELRPAWWFYNVRAIMEAEDPGDKELVHQIHEIETILSRDGPSTDCWGVPLGWEDDHDPGSSCAFNPSIVPP